MSHRPLHLARRPVPVDPDAPYDPEAPDDPDDPADRVLDIIASYDRGYSFLEVAIDLWRIAGDEAHVRAIERVLASAYAVEPPHLEGEAVVALRALLDGLEAALIANVTDPTLRLSMAKVVELRGRETALVLDDARGELATGAIQEAMIYVGYARDILDEAIAADAQLYFD